MHPRSVSLRPGILVAATLVLLGTELLAADPFALLSPPVVVRANDRQLLDRGEGIAQQLPSDSGDLGVFATVAVSIDGGRLADWIRRIEALKTSRYVHAIKRLSNPPALSDFESLTLAARDLEALRRCRPNDCDIKLSPEEIAEVQTAVRAAGRAADDSVQRTFRSLLHARAIRFNERGDASLRPEQQRKVSVFLSRAPFLAERMPEFSRYVTEYPQATAPGAESFLYWANEELAGRNVVTLSHVSMIESQNEGVPATLVVSKQIFVTRYVDVGVAMTMLLRGDRAGQNFLAYTNRTSTDVFDGMLGGLIRPVAQRRVRNEAETVLEQLRGRLQSGPPPASR